MGHHAQVMPGSWAWKLVAQQLTHIIIIQGEKNLYSQAQNTIKIGVCLETGLAVRRELEVSMGR